MKGVIVVIFIAFSLLTCFEARATKYALLIGIESYSNGVPRLNGPKDDARNIRKFLLENGGFIAGNITLLTNQAATRNNILQQLSLLSNKSKQSDEIVIYYSGHGSQVSDFNNDEADGLDETIVPVDTVKKNGMFHNMITDDEVQESLDRIKAEKISLIIDSCHSGTITRGLGMVTDGITSVTKTIFPDEIVEVVPAQSFVERRREKVFLKKQNPAHLSVWTAASSSQLAFTDIETQKGSLFTNRLILGLGEKKADYNNDLVVTNSELLEYLRNESDLFCQRNKKICKLGLTPTLETTSDKLPQQVTLLGSGSRPAGESNDPSLSAYIDSVSIHKNREKIQVSISPEKNIRIGTEISLKIKTQISGYLLILDVDSMGRLTQLFPNKYSKVPWDNKFPKETTLFFPAESYGFDFVASEPAGNGRIITIIVEDKISFKNLLQQNMTLDEVKNSKHYLAELAYGLRATYRADTFNRRARWSVALTEYTIVND